MPNWDNPVVEWYEYHREDYEEVRKRLAAMRNVMLRGRMEYATDALEKSCVFSVLSIQTERERHEDAYVAWDNGLRLSNAASQTVYGGQKAEWLFNSRASFDFEEAVMLWRNEGIESARAYIVENFTGLSWTKASFALAMIGGWELMCIDSNVKNVLGEKIELPDRIRSESTYKRLSGEVYDATGLDVEPFIAQWTTYDVGRGEHARHLPFYRSVLYRQ